MQTERKTVSNETEPESSLEAAVADALERGDGTELAALVRSLPSAPTETRKTCVRRLRDAVADDPTVVEPALERCEDLLADGERSVRLTTAKLFVAVAERDPDAVVPIAPALSSRLADEDEFYYVRARSAEALGYLALENPAVAASPDVLADLRIGLSFDEPEVREKLAKALEFVARGDPGRLRHHVASLSDHLDDENDRVRYHLCTALAVVGCEYPEPLVDGRAALLARLSDENGFVRGRAAEALGLLARADGEDGALPLSELEAMSEDDRPFVTKRATFAIDAVDEGTAGDELPDGVGTLDVVQRSSDRIAEEITASGDDSECPLCGVSLPEGDPPMCPNCGAPF